MIVSGWSILRAISVSENVEKIKMYIVYAITFFGKACLFKVTWKNMVEPNRLQMPVWRMRIECWILKDTNTQSEHVILYLFHGNNGCANAPQCYIYTYIVYLVIPINAASVMHLRVVYVRCITFLTIYNSMVFCLIHCRNVVLIWELRSTGLLRGE
jgi:hypothetical protein